jgi:hypothetical protein
LMIPSHLIAQVAGAIFLCPPDVIEQTLPMVAPLPSSLAELKERQEVDKSMAQCWESDDGYEVQLADEWIVNGERFLESKEVYRPSTYGEITRLGSRQLFHQMGMHEGKTNNDMNFMDLGSGAGKLVLHAYLELEHLTSAIGVELSPTRHQTAMRAWNKVQQQLSNEHNSNFRSIEFVEGDIFLADISKATHIFVSSLCFTAEMIQRLESKIQEEATSLWCVASLAKLENFGKPSIRYIEMSWTKPNGSPVYFYEPDK